MANGFYENNKVDGAPNTWDAADAEAIEEGFRLVEVDLALYGKIADVVSVSGDWTFSGAVGAGALTDYDLSVGDTDGTPTYGLVRLGNSVFGRTSSNVGGYNLDGAVISQNVGDAVTGDLQFVWMDSTGDIRLALPTSGVGNATYNPRSLLVAGPSINDSAVVTVGYWQSQGIFNNLTCDTGTSGADMGVQNDLEVEGDIFTDSIKESTTDAGVTIEGVIMKDNSLEAPGTANKINNTIIGANEAYIHESSTNALTLRTGATGNFKSFVFSTAGDLTLPGSLRSNAILESSAGAGVTIDGVLLKDSEVTTNTIHEKTANTGVTVDGVLLKDNVVNTDFITEKTNGAGILVDGDLTVSNPDTTSARLDLFRNNPIGDLDAVAAINFSGEEATNVQKFSAQIGVVATGIWSGNTTPSSMRFNVWDGAAFNSTLSVDDWSVGINNTQPDAVLHTITNGGTGVQFDHTGSWYGGVWIGGDTTGKGRVTGWHYKDAAGAATPNYNGLRLEGGDTGGSGSFITLHSADGIGVNIDDPTVALDIAGDVKIAGTTNTVLEFEKTGYNHIKATGYTNTNWAASFYPIGYRARGSLATPTWIGSGDAIMTLAGRVYTGTHGVDGAFSTGNDVSIIMESAESDGHGTRIRFTTTEIGQATDTERVRIADDGKVGIGVTVPLAKFHVDNNISTISNWYQDAGTAIKIYNSSGDGVMHLGGSTATGRILFGNGTVSDEFRISSRNSGVTIDAYAVFDKVSNLGLGVFPTERLHVGGNALVNGANIQLANSNKGVRLTSGATYGAVLGYDGSAYNQLSLRSNALVDSGITIETGGDIGFGTNAPDAEFHFAGENLRQSDIYGGHYTFLRSAVPSGNTQNLGTIIGKGYSTGTTEQKGCEIIMVSADAWSASDTPGKIIFKTTPDNSTFPGTVMTIRQDRYVEVVEPILLDINWETTGVTNGRYKKLASGMVIVQTNKVSGNMAGTFPLGYRPTDDLRISIGDANPVYFAVNSTGVMTPLNCEVEFRYEMMFYAG